MKSLPHYNSKNRLRIGLDLDGVIIDHAENKLKVAKSLGFNFKKEDTAPDIMKHLMPEAKYKEMGKRVYEELSLTAPPIPYAIGSIKELREQGVPLFIISARVKPKFALRWLRQRKLTPAQNIFFSKNAEDKNRIARKLKIDIFLDDKIKVLKALKNVKTPVFFNPYKVDINKDKFLEASSWKEFLKIVCSS